MSYATIDDLRSQLGAADKKPVSPEYVAKMMHPIPPATVADRAKFILERVTDKRVLEFGATGPMHDAVVKAAASVYGVDREDGPGVFGFDLDDVTSECLPPRVVNGIGTADYREIPDGAYVFDVVLCGEVIEHLGNPQWFLTRLRKQYPGVPVLITVPNAFSAVGMKSVLKGVEQVNRDHVAYYSWKTLSVLLERVGYRVNEFHWYHGQPGVAEGLIVVAE